MFEKIFEIVIIIMALLVFMLSLPILWRRKLYPEFWLYILLDLVITYLLIFHY